MTMNSLTSFIEQLSYGFKEYTSVFFEGKKNNLDETLSLLSTHDIDPDFDRSDAFYSPQLQPITLPIDDNLLFQPNSFMKIPASITSKLKHRRQIYDYDCGIACVSMVFSGLGIKNNSIQTLLDLIKIDSIWTIDLSYLLKKHGCKDFSIILTFKHLNFEAFFTSHIGINFQYTKSQFYKESLHQDQKRIHALFAGAKDAGIRVVPMELRLDDFRRFLYCLPQTSTKDSQATSSIQYACIVLVNAELLYCRICRKKGKIISTNKRAFLWIDEKRKAKKITSSLGCCGFRSKTKNEEIGEFTGHYILMIGYNPDEDLFYYRDPGREEEICAVSSKTFDRARCSEGTDHDAIVVKIAELDVKF